MSPETQQQPLEQQRLLHKQRQKSAVGKWAYRLINSRSAKYNLLKKLVILALALFAFALGFYLLGPIISS